MNHFKLSKVLTPKDAKYFIQVNVLINSKSPDYIRPLDKDINDVFTPNKNRSFQYGCAQRWILRDGKGDLIGRIAAFVNQRYKIAGDDLLAGGIGFFDCIDDHWAAKILFDAAKEWLQDQGVDAMDGPINFGQNDRWWGLLVEGFQDPPYLMNYNMPYYKELFEAYGFRVFYNQICYSTSLDKPLKPTWHKIHAEYEKSKNYSIKHIDKNNLEKFSGDFCSVYNSAWANYGVNRPIEPDEALITFQQMLPVLDRRLLLLAYNADKPIATFISIPDLNQLFRYMNGKFGLYQILKFLWLSSTKPCNKLIGLTFGIIPEFQRTGLTAYLVVEAAKIVTSPQSRYTEYEMVWIGDYNLRMYRQIEKSGLMQKSRLLTTYRYLFDKNKEFKRHPLVF